MPDTFPPVTLSARRFALAWSAVQQACSDDKDRMWLYRTTLVERHYAGVMIFSTDSYLALWAWVPCIEEGDGPDVVDLTRPDLDEAPLATLLVCDEAQMTRALVKHIKASTKPQGGDQPDRKAPIDLAVGTLGALAVTGDQPTLGSVFDDDRPALVMASFGTMTAAPLVSASEFPDWREIARAKPVKSASRIGLNPRYLARVGAINIDSSPGVWITTLGQRGGLAVEIPGDPRISGRWMPLAEQAPQSEQLAGNEDLADDIAAAKARLEGE